MSNVESVPPIGPSSVGNIINMALQIYRSNLKRYLQQGFFASLWMILPIYGWAKYAEISMRLARLAYGELTDQPETIEEATQFTKPWKWTALGVALLVGLIILGVYLGLVFAGGILMGIVILALVALGSIISPTSLLFKALLVVAIGAVMLGILLVLTRVSARLMLSEMPIAVEEGFTASSAIGRSWALTEKSAWRLMGVLIVGFLIALVVQGPAIAVILKLQLPYVLNKQVVPMNIRLVAQVVGIISTTLILPFWASIKAAVYYDLRARKEGLGIQLRDR